MHTARTRPIAKPPRQARSRQTQSRVIDALARLLLANDWSAITTDQIAAEAGTSVGALYKRFATKAEILHALLQRTQTELDPPSVPRTDCDLRTRIDTLIDGMAQAWAKRAHIIRAAIAAQGASASALPPQLIDLSRKRLGEMAEWLLECRAEIKHPNPKRAVAIGLFFTLQPLQQALLNQGRQPTVPQAELVAEAKRLLSAYLLTAT